MMTRKKTGIILIVVGICIPLLALPFVSGYSGKKRFIENYYDVGIRIGGDSGPVSGAAGTTGTSSKHSSFLPKKIPLRFILIVTVILVYAGITKIIGPKRDGEDD